MAGTCKIEIKENKVELKQMLGQAKTSCQKERLQVVYLLKTNKALNVTHAAEIAGRNRVTLQNWLAKYHLEQVWQYFKKGLRNRVADFN